MGKDLQDHPSNPSKGNKPLRELKNPSRNQRCSPSKQHNPRSADPTPVKSRDQQIPNGKPGWRIPKKTLFLLLPAGIGNNPNPLRGCVDNLGVISESTSGSRCRFVHGRAAGKIPDPKNTPGAAPGAPQGERARVRNWDGKEILIQIHPKREGKKNPNPDPA